MKEAQDYPWFNLADYEPRRQFGFRDWAIMLRLRDRLADDIDRNSQTEWTLEETDELWNYYLDEALPSKYWSNRSDERYEHLLPSDPLLEDITHLALPDDQGNRPISTFSIENYSARLLQVDVLAPETILIGAFESWLRNCRRNNPLPISRPGKPALNLEITLNHLKSWADYNILAVLDIDLYSKLKKGKKLSRQILFERLNPQVREMEPNAEGWTREARDKAKEALSCLYTLIAQAKSPG